MTGKLLYVPGAKEFFEGRAEGINSMMAAVSLLAKESPAEEIARKTGLGIFDVRQLQESLKKA